MNLTEDLIDAYLADGYLQIPGVFTPDEMAILRKDCERILSPDRGHPDGNISELSSDSIRVSFGVDLDSEAVAAAVRVPRILGPVRQFLGDHVYLFQTRINAKMGHVGEGYPWHTDFANWINDGIQRGSINDMITVSVLLTDSTPANGGLQGRSGIAPPRCRRAVLRHRVGGIPVVQRTGLIRPQGARGDATGLHRRKAGRRRPFRARDHA